MNNITKNPITSIAGVLLVALGLYAYYHEIDSTICSMVVLGGLGLLGAKDSIFGGNNQNPPIP